MKPLNLDNKPCSPISSNCVIWQGPDIPCIKLCTGDTVSDVVNKLATELCAIIDQLNITNYDLSCFDLAACPPQTFQQLIQFLIDQICLSQGITTTDGKVSGCPDCLVTVAPCFQIGNQTTMQLVDYVQMIAERVCSIIDQITVINNQIQNLEIRVEILENTPPPTFTLPSIATNCFATAIGSASATIDVVLNALVNDPIIGYCQLIGATGDPADILSAVATQCIDSTDPSLSNPGETMGSAYGPYTGFGTWNNTPITAADAINNLWIALCDIYNAVTPIDVVDTNTINLTYTGGILRADMQDTGWIPLLGFSYMSGASFKPQCRRIGNVIHFKGTIYVPIGTLNSGGGGTAEPVADPDDYNGIDSGYTFNTIQATSGSDPDACLLSGPSYVAWAVGQEALRLQFHRGNSVIPPGILGVGETLDASASVSGRVICERVARSTAIDDIAMTSVIGLSLSSAGALLVTSANFNDTFRGAANCVGKTSLTRQLCTTAISGENIPEYFGTAPSQFNATSSGAYQPNLIGSSDTYRFSQDMSRAEQLGGLAINISDIKAFVNDCSGNTPTFISC
jgi:hypothetical protein